MTYSELLSQLNALSSEQLTQDVCIYDKHADEYYMQSVEVVFTTEECDTLDPNHAVIQF